ncbi:MAG: thiol:disulfide interchange protein DsbA/DsbL [Chromatiales bacterium]|jgi:thiol:disulfide interchange protein DsbA|nr:thiol:disulfide interchange protein DsbA/DsbL [Chromatiales bacterium]MDX9767179.1 thiol:disulfide interchange protein DsbA/DsbL [Ectothiorhodospiraceae bacterium]
MKFSRRQFNRLVLAALGTAVLPISAQALQQDHDYTLIVPPQPGDVAGKIEVLEFFSYGCPHCMEFHPLVKQWSAALPPDVDFRRVPVSFGRAAWANLARLYYALEYLDELPRLDDAVFDAIHKQRAGLFTDKAIQQWAERQGVDGNRFRAIYDSFDMNIRLKRGERLTQSYKVQGVPLLTVAGRYAVTGQSARGYGDLLRIADLLITQARG